MLISGRQSEIEQALSCFQEENGVSHILKEKTLLKSSCLISSHRNLIITLKEISPKGKNYHNLLNKSLFHIIISNLSPNADIFLHGIMYSGFSHRISNLFHFYTLFNKNEIY